MRCGFASPCGSFVETRAFHKSACHNSSFYGNRTFRKQPQRNVLYFVAGFGNLRCTIESLNTKQAPVQYVSLAKELQTALIKLFKEKSSDSLEQLLAGDCVWKNCIKTVKGRQEIVNEFRGIISFVVEPCLYLVESCNNRLHSFDSIPNRKTVFEWTVSATWPIFWKPVVTYSGHSLVMWNEHGLVSYMEDFPTYSPWKILWNVLYSIRYLYFAVVADPPENVCNGRKLIRSTRRYSLWEEVSHVRWEYTNSHPLETRKGVFSCFPVLPAEVFTDKFTRNETIFWTTPLFFLVDFNALPEEKMTWSFPYPIRFSSSQVDLQQGVRWKRISASRRVASKAWLGDITREQLSKVVEDFVHCLKEDGVLKETDSKEHLEIWWSHSNSYLGFNRWGQLALAMYRNSVVDTSFIHCYIPSE